jgi:hypothetical protein
MNSRSLSAVLSLLALLAISLGPGGGLGAQEVLRPDLAGIATGDGWTLVNRGATIETGGGQTVVTFDARSGDGVAWLDGVDFHNGTIDVMIRGKNNPGRSFVGVAFRGADADQFFRARIVISKPEIRVYVGENTEPCLVVHELTDRMGGRVGLWMGNGSDGSFAELVLRPAGGS